MLQSNSKNEILICFKRRISQRTHKATLMRFKASISKLILNRMYLRRRCLYAIYFNLIGKQCACSDPITKYIYAINLQLWTNSSHL